MSTPLSQTTSAAIDPAAPTDEPSRLAELLKRCPPTTLAAATAFRATRNPEHIVPFVLGVLERYVERELRPKLKDPDDSLRLTEDLALDSLTMMEVVLLIEDALGISVNNDELMRLKTLGDIRTFIAGKAAAST